MGTLLVFDDSASPQALPRLTGRVVLFPLTSDGDLAAAVESRLAQSAEVETENTALLVNEQVDAFRAGVAEWGRRAGQCDLGGKPLVERFMYPGGGVSAWWFGNLAEKNPFKTDAFVRIAQLRAVKNRLKAEDCREMAAMVGDRAFEECLALVAGPGFSVPGREESRLRTLGSRAAKWGFPIKEFLVGLLHIFRFAAQGILARKRLGPAPDRMPTQNGLLFVGYSPAHDPKAAEAGKYVSRYYPRLHEVLEGWGGHWGWLLMHVTMGGKPFRQTLDLVRSLAKRGEKLLVLQEFFGFRETLEALRNFALTALRGVRYARQAGRGLYGPEVPPEAEPVVRKLWYRSLCGSEAAQGAMYYAVFRRLFRELPELSGVVYLMEMHAWEKAMIAAAGANAPGTRTIGFQHASISTNYFHFINHPADTARTGPAALPLPSVMGLNGALTEGALAPCAYPGIRPLESLRTLYVERLLAGGGDARPLGKPPVLLVAGSISEGETGALARMAARAFPKSGEVVVRFKGHPMCPFDAIFRKMGIDPAAAGYELIGGDIASALEAADFVFVPASTVAVEALAFGCKVLLPIFPDSMQMNPLADHVQFYQPVDGPDRLRRVVLSMIEEGAEKIPQREFIAGYWHLDGALNNWRSVLMEETGNG